MTKEIFDKIKKILKKEPRLIEIKKAEKIIFVGDTHGDLEVSQKIIQNKEIEWLKYKKAVGKRYEKEVSPYEIKEYLPVL